MPLGTVSLRVQVSHLLRINFPDDSSRDSDTTTWSYYPAHALLHKRFGLFPGRSPLLGESLVYFLFLQVLRCFSSLRSPLHLGADSSPSGCWVVPFGNPRIKGYLLLPAAYRSLSRPSSPPRAKASTRRPNFLSPLTLHIYVRSALLILSAVIRDSFSVSLYKVFYLQSCVSICQRSIPHKEERGE